jgi:septal ring factor EnvC (AmiA/AmiB activator)
MVVKSAIYGICVAALLFGPISSYLAAQSENIIEQKNELQKIKSEMEQSRRNLDSLQNAEKKIQKELNDYEQKAAANETVLNRLNQQLNSVKNDIKKAKGKLESSQERMSASRSRYIGNLKYLYSGTRWELEGMTNPIKEEKDAMRRVIYLKSLAVYNRGELNRISDYLKSAENEYGTLVGKEKTIGEARRKKKSEYTIAASQKGKRERELTKLKRKKQNESERYSALSETARQMEELIARLESEREKRAEKKGEAVILDAGNFIRNKGALPGPLEGKITQGFGWSSDPVTKLKSYSPGVEIVGNKNNSIAAIADGTVAYVGNLRGYGNFIIIEHEDGYYSTYAGLVNVTVELNQSVVRGEKLGQTPDGKIKFELRKGKESLDPIEWIKIDYFK